MKTTAALVSEIEERAFALDISISEICRRANVARSTFQRWKTGTSSPITWKVSEILSVLTREETKRASKKG